MSNVPPVNQPPQHPGQPPYPAQPPVQPVQPAVQPQQPPLAQPAYALPAFAQPLQPQAAQPQAAQNQPPVQPQAQPQAPQPQAHPGQAPYQAPAAAPQHPGQPPYPAHPQQHPQAPYQPQQQPVAQPAQPPLTQQPAQPAPPTAPSAKRQPLPPFQYPTKGAPAGAAAVPPAGVPPVAGAFASRDMPPAAPPRKRYGAIIAVSILSFVLLLAAAASVWLIMQLNAANTLVEKQDKHIEEQDDTIKEQEKLIDEKKTFGIAMTAINKHVDGLAALPFASLLKPEYGEIAEEAWSNRWNLEALAADTETANSYLEELDKNAAAAKEAAAVNATGSTWEATLDQLGGGYVSTVIEDMNVFCGMDALACVGEDTPFVVHVDAASVPDPLMTEWMRTGVAYHEFAHVLQFTNPVPTAETLKVFGGDVETMADCYTLTTLAGWTLDHEVWINDNEYWKIAIGYGYTCTEPERQAIRDWITQLGGAATAPKAP